MAGGFVMGGVLITGITLAKYVMGVLLERPNTWMDRVLPFIAKTAICMVIAIIIAQTRDVLLDVGVILLLAAILHNTLGYAGVWPGILGITPVWHFVRQNRSPARTHSNC